MSYQEQEITLSIWDCGGQEQFKSMGLFDNYFKGAIVAVLMFDLTRSLTIQGLDTWYNFIDASRDTEVLLVGGKSDLPRDPSIDESFIAQTVEEYNACRFIETTSKDGLGVDLVFNEIARLALNKIG
jgi:GTPase SAR1 family protein